MTKVFYIGDSTVQLNKIDTYPQTGMSQVLHLFLREDVIVCPHGKNGRSTKSFLDEGRFEPVRAAMEPGDVLLIQFGHNDEKDDPLRHTDPFGSYQENLGHFLNAARTAGAYPVLITPIARRLFDENGRFRPGSHGDYPEAVRQLGRKLAVPVVDLTRATEELVEKLGDEASKPLYVWPKDNTHLQYEGAVRFAGMLTEQLADFGSPFKELMYQTQTDDALRWDCL